MERLLQYLDDIDDLVGLVGLLYERIRQLTLALGALAGTLLVALAAMWLALVHPPLALATGTLLFVSLLYRSVTAPLQPASA